MGLPICRRLLETGFEVVATDRDTTHRAEAKSLGARWRESSEAVAQTGRPLITILPGSAELEEVMSDLLPVMEPGSAWVDMTSTSPKTAAALRSLAGELECLDAPMGGGPNDALTGKLELFVGGTPATVAHHRNLLETLGRVHHVGGPGAGTIVKHLVNLLWFGQAVATAEALLLARRTGLDLSTVQRALTHSAADSEFIRTDVPALLQGDYLTDFGLDRCCEELDAITELAHDLDMPFELSSQVRDLYDRALKHLGARDGERLAVAVLESQAGIALRDCLGQKVKLE